MASFQAELRCRYPGRAARLRRALGKSVALPNVRKHRFVVIGGFGESVSLCELPVIVEGFGEHPARLAASKASSGTIDRLPSAIRRSSPVFLLMVGRSPYLLPEF